MFSQKVYYTDFFSSRGITTDTCWTDWVPCFAEVIVYKDSIVVYDEDTYFIQQKLEDVIEENVTTIRYKATNKDNERVQIRLRIQCDGIKQLYIDFNDKIWVYNLN